MSAFCRLGFFLTLSYRVFLTVVFALIWFFPVFRCHVKSQTVENLYAILRQFTRFYD